VRRVSQFMHNPSEDHMGAITKILQYLKGTQVRESNLKKADM
jgi:hypothetical protein